MLSIYPALFVLSPPYASFPRAPSLPQVDCLSRLLERATRHGDTTKQPLPASRPAAAAVAAADGDDGTGIAGTSSNEAAADASNNTPVEGEKGEREAQVLPATWRVLCGREVPAEVEVEAALLNALGVVSLLIRHEASDTATAR